MNISASAQDVRVLSKVEQKSPDECWPWTAHVCKNGYGQAFYNGRVTSAHRAVFMAANGVVLTRGQDVCHRCDNPICCNPSHLFVGTRSDNMRDMVSKGRNVAAVHPECFPRGEESHRAVLTESDVLEIKRLIATGLSCRMISERFNITRSGVDKIKQGKAWRHVTLN